MRNTIGYLYCTRDRNTEECPMHDTYKRGGTFMAQMLACIKCNKSEVDLTDAGKSLRTNGLPRLSPGMDLSIFEEE